MAGLFTALELGLTMNYRAPTAYHLAKILASSWGANGIDKIKFFEWFLGMDNIYVQAMKRDAEK